jgi:hypothetical protein
LEWASKVSKLFCKAAELILPATDIARQPGIATVQQVKHITQLCPAATENNLQVTPPA